MPALVVPVARAGRIGTPGELVHVVGEFAKARFALAQRLFAGDEHRLGALAFGYVLGDDIDADDVTFRALQRMPVRDPDVVGIAFVGTLSVNLHAGDGLAGSNDGLNQAFHLFGDLRNGLANRAPDMVGDRYAADLGQALIDLQIPAVGRQKRKPYRCGVVDQLELGRRLAIILRLVQRLGFPHRANGRLCNQCRLWLGLWHRRAPGQDVERACR